MISYVMGVFLNELLMIEFSDILVVFCFDGGYFSTCII